MANLTPCPFCGADIEDDSWYCDQCANQLYRCPKCGRLCKGKFCPKCGCPTQPASQSAQPGQPASPRPAAPAQQAAPVQPPRPSTDPQAFSPVGTGTCINSGAPAGPTRLVCQAMGVTLQLIPGAIVGRVYGNYAAQLGTFQYISGTQARLDFNGSQWTITDLGSRNGTAVNGIPCAPALPFRTGDTICFSRYYNFQVE